jgi:hypothetical protein
MKFTAKKLIDEKKIVPIALLPELTDQGFIWQVGDDLLEYNRKTKQFSLEVYEFIEDDWQHTKTLDHAQAYQVALDEGIIYE